MKDVDGLSSVLNRKRSNVTQKKLDYCRMMWPHELGGREKAKKVGRQGGAAGIPAYILEFRSALSFFWVFSLLQYVESEVPE